MSTLSDRVIRVPDIISHFTDAELNSEYHNKYDYANAVNKYGAIYKVISFSEVTDVNLIKQYAWDWIRRNYYDGVLSFTVKAVDLHLLGVDIDKFMCGDRIVVLFMDEYGSYVARTLTCLSAQYDLLKPDNSTFKIGVPDVSANVKYRESIANKKSTKPRPKDKTPPPDMPSIIEGLREYGLDIGDPETV